jgi:hypothetical protein
MGDIPYVAVGDYDKSTCGRARKTRPQARQAPQDAAMDAARHSKTQVFPEEKRLVLQDSAGADRGGDRSRAPKPSHPWNHPQRRILASESTKTTPKTCKLTMAVTLVEFQNFRKLARRLGKSNSELMREHFPKSLLLPPDEDSRDIGDSGCTK